MELDRATRNHLINKLLNTRAVSMSIAVIFALAGCWMIFVGIKDQGVIDVRTPFITGQAKSGFVGVLLIFAVVVIVVITNLAKRPQTGADQKITVRSGDMQIEWQGKLYYMNEADHVEALLKAAAQTALTKSHDKSQA